MNTPDDEQSEADGEREMSNIVQSRQCGRGRGSRGRGRGRARGRGRGRSRGRSQGRGQTIGIGQDRGGQTSGHEDSGNNNNFIFVLTLFTKSNRLARHIHTSRSESIHWFPWSQGRDTK